MLDFEAALARACAGAGLVSSAAAEAITAACRADRFDVGVIGREAAASGNPVLPLLAALRAALPADAAEHLHLGATSQDVIDTASMLVARRALRPILEDATAALRACASLAGAHRDTVLFGRTLLQQAVPITFGLKAAGWMAGIGRARSDLIRLDEQQTALQLGGAAGTLAPLGDAAGTVAAAVGRDLGLTVPPLPWHTERSRPAMIAGGLAVLTGSLGKVARDVTLLAQNEVGEVAPGPSGHSSAMPHKRNPVAAVAVIACAARTPGLLATITGSLVQEHERAAGAWQAEWETWSDLLRLTGSAASWAAEMLAELSLDPERMRANLEAGGDRIAQARSPEAHLGSAGAFIGRALAEYRCDR